MDRPTHAVLLAVAVTLASATLAGTARSGAPAAQEVLYSSEGNRLRRYDLATVGTALVRQDILIERAGLDAKRGRDVNGMICPLPDGSGRFVAGEDSGQPNPPPGWGLFEADGKQLGKLASTYYVDQAEPFGCAFNADGILFTTEVGEQGFGTANGQLIMWFPPYDVFPGHPGVYPDTNRPSKNFCKLATDLGTAGGIAIDDQGRVYVAATSETKVHRFSPPFPTSPNAAGGCGSRDDLDSPFADVVNREVFLRDNNLLSTFTGLAIGPNGHLYAASIISGRIAEYDLDGEFVRHVLEPAEELPPFATGTPQGLAFDSQGTLYYADLDLVGEFPDLGPGPNGKVWRIRFDDMGAPQPPEIVGRGLAFPDGLGVLPGRLPSEWRTYAGSARRLFFNPHESIITRANAADLQVRWRFPTLGIITASPSVAVVRVPGEGRIQVVYFASWDGNVYAVRLSDGSELWRFETELQPGASFPNAASVDVTRLDGVDRVFIGAGETMYSLDAVTGEELWRFAAGTGCRDADGQAPGLCGFDGERNEIESSAIVADGMIFFGMDVNDREAGKGGFYAVDARDGRLRWFFDLESGSTCRPFPDDDIRRFDGYASEAELGLPEGFLTTRPGCDFDRTATGCGNVWSSPAVDFDRQLLFFASSNCDTDEDPETPRPPPPMPPYDEAVVALDFDGEPAWVWRPREVDNDDLAFGAVPNLFQIDFEGSTRDVLGVGNKDGTYYVIDRDGVNGASGVRWDDVDAFDLPYWSRNVVPGGEIGGIVGTAAVDETQRRVTFSTAPGFNPTAPQQPTVHTLDLDTGDLVWDNGTGVDLPEGDASFGPTSGIPGVAFVGSIVAPLLRAYQTLEDDGSLLASIPLPPVVIGAATASAPVAIDGTLLVGTGIGTRTDDPADISDLTSRYPSDLFALCVSGTPGCAACDDGEDNDGDEFADFPDDPGCEAAADVSEGLPGGCPLCGAGTLAGREKLRVRNGASEKQPAEWSIVFLDGTWTAEDGGGNDYQGTYSERGDSGRKFDLMLSPASLNDWIDALRPWALELANITLDAEPRSAPKLRLVLNEAGTRGELKARLELRGSRNGKTKRLIARLNLDGRLDLGE